MTVEGRGLSVRRRGLIRVTALLALLACAGPGHATAQVAVRGATVYTLTGPPITDGVVVVSNGKIVAVGAAATVKIPAGLRVLTAKVVTPGLIDAHATAGVSGIFNTPHDQDQLDRSGPLQPELRAIDTYNPNDPLVAYLRSYGITVLHTGHAPGELISGQTMVVKTVGKTADAAVLRDPFAVAATLGPGAQRGGKDSPGTRGKAVAMLREELIRAQEYLAKRAEARASGAADADRRPKDDGKVGPSSDKPPDLPERNLRLEALGRVLTRELPLLVTAQRAQDIAGALRLAAEFKFRLILDGAAESYLLVSAIQAAGVPVIVHPAMQRAIGESENQSFETAATLHTAGIPIALQSGFEGYVPKTRVVLFEAAIAAANGLGAGDALAAITRDAAQLLGIADRVGRLAPGKDGDLALYDGDPFEYTTHCVGVVIDGQVVSELRR